MTSIPQEAKREIIQNIINDKIGDKQELERNKRKISQKYKLPKVPSNAEILESADKSERKEVLPILQRKPVRSISGVTVITVMPRPYPCPKSKPCVYCPGGPDNDTPQSYTGEEPASARAKEAGYDPEKQVVARKKQLRAIGHKVDKVELIIFGGTFPAQPVKYQEQFVHSCLDAISNTNTSNLEMAKKRAENSDTRTIGVTFETRPDYCKKDHINHMLRFGGTRVEIGVQTVYNEIYELVNREHTVEDVVEATRLAKDSGLAIVYHMMPGLPGSTPEKDLEAFRTIFKKSEFRPDMLKIYPCLVTKGTELYEWWKAGNFDPLEGQEAVELVAEMKKIVPKWVRIQRVQRDIPSHLIEAGVWKGNLRELVKRRLEEQGEKCQCIRCREVGHQMLKENKKPSLEDSELFIDSYDASEGNEIFISTENPTRETIFGHLRLRIPSNKAYRSEITDDTALVRMLYVFGELVPVGKKSTSNAWQHHGLGEFMLKEAERIASDRYDTKKMAVLSGIGTRDYYRKFGYELEGPYMTKEL